MRRYLVLLLSLLSICGTGYPVAQKLTSLTADSTPSTDSLVYTVDDPAGTPVSRKTTIGELFSAGTDLDADGVISATSWDIDRMVGDTVDDDVLDVPVGGTGVGTLTDGGILLGSGTGAITALGVATNGQIPIGDGTTDPVLGTISGTSNQITVTNGAGTITVGLSGTPDLSGTLALSGDISPSQITADQNDYAPTGLSTASTLRLNSDASRNITGLTGGADGRILFIHNIGTFDIVLKDEDVSSTAANRFALDSDTTILADGLVVLQYDSTSTRWRAVAGSSGGGGGVATSGDSATSFFPAGTIEHERGGLEADVSAYSGLVAISGGVTSNVASSADLAGQITNETGTGVLVYNTEPVFVTTVGIPWSTTPTTNATGEMAFDTDGNGSTAQTMTIQAYDGSTNNYFFGVREYPTTNNQVLTYDSASNDLKWAVPTGSGDITDVFSATSGDANQMVIGSGEYLDCGTLTSDAQGEGLILPRATDVTAATGEGEISWDTDDDKLYVGTGSGLQEIGTGGGSSGGSIDLLVQSAKLTGSFVTQDDATQGAQIDAGESGWRLLFDATTDEGAVWQFRMPPSYSSGLTAKIGYSMTSATANDVEFEVAIMAVSDGDAADISTPSFDTQNVGTATVPGTAGYIDEISITLTNGDSVAVGDLVFVQLSTDADDATNDDATGDREVVYFQLTWS